MLSATVDRPCIVYVRWKYLLLVCMLWCPYPIKQCNVMYSLHLIITVRPVNDELGWWLEKHTGRVFLSEKLEHILCWHHLHVSTTDSPCTQMCIWFIAAWISQWNYKSKLQLSLVRASGSLCCIGTSKSSSRAFFVLCTNGALEMISIKTVLLKLRKVITGWLKNPLISYSNSIVLMSR